MARTTVWIDFAGVLTPPPEETLARFARLVGAPPKELIAAMAAVAKSYGTDDIMEPLDTPLVDGERWAELVRTEVRDRFGRDIDLTDFAAKWFAGRPANAPMVAYVERLRAAGHFVGMMSNMVPGFAPHWPKLVDPALFDDLLFSYEVGVRKPQPEMYALAAERAGADPADCLLIDDLEQNCAGARAHGWNAVLFTTAETAIPELDALVRAG